MQGFNMEFVKNRKYFYLLSLIIIIPGVVSLIFWGLRLGIDFSGGAMAEISWAKDAKSSDIREEVKKANVQNLFVQTSGDQSLLLRYPAKTQEEGRDKLNKIISTIKPATGDIKETNFSIVGPTVSKDLTSKAIKAVIIASIVIVLYIAYAFRKVQKPASSWSFGICAIIALLHDLLVVTGIFSILGHFFLWVEVDALFITALLTVLGFSVHDTIVVFDRIRENLRLYPNKPFEWVVNESLVQTLARSINTSLTVVLTLLALFLLGGDTIKGLVLALIIGVISGTYSSIFNASQLMVTWKLFADRQAI